MKLLRCHMNCSESNRRSYPFYFSSSLHVLVQGQGLGHRRLTFASEVGNFAADIHTFISRPLRTRGAVAIIALEEKKQVGAYADGDDVVVDPVRRSQSGSGCSSSSGTIRRGFGQRMG